MAIIQVNVGVTATGELTYTPASAITDQIRGVVLREYIPQESIPVNTIEVLTTATAAGATSSRVNTPRKVGNITGVTVEGAPDDFTYEVSDRATEVVFTHSAAAGVIFRVSYEAHLANAAEAQAFVDNLTSLDGVKLRPTNVTAVLTETSGTAPNQIVSDVILVKNSAVGTFTQQYTPTTGATLSTNAVIKAILT